jgi:membrane associated rhomboid family serine protease
LKKLRSRFDRFCFRHRDKGIRNLMMYIALGSALVYVMSLVDKTNALYYFLCFDRAAILRGQVWRLFTYALTFDSGNILYTAIGLICYYSLGQAIENSWGTFRFNLFYFSGMLMMDIYCMIFGGYADVYYLNLSLFLAYATLYPNAHFLLFFVIPVKAWIFALFDLALVLFGLFAYPFPSNLFSVISLANYFLFFGKDVMNVIPLSWQANFRRLFRKKKSYAPKQAKTIPFPNAGSYEATVASVNAPYTHRCTVCGKTDVTHPDLEFRYCSRCNGYHCYCEEHISNHTHVQ